MGKISASAPGCEGRSGWGLPGVLLTRSHGCCHRGGWRCGGDLTGTKVAATSLLLAVVGALVVGELQQEKGPPSGGQTAAPMQVEAELPT